MKQAVILLSHVHSPSIVSHFNRLKEETAGLVDAFFCLHRPGGAQPGDAADFIITEKDEEACMPHRLAYRKKHDLPLGTCGFLDLVFLSAVQRLPDYDYYYMMEFDVDYAGNWREFFEQVAPREGDLIAAHIHWRLQNPDWIHWRWHYSVPVPNNKQLMALIVLMRMSRRMVDVYTEALRSGKWVGNIEALAPTIALNHNLSIVDLGGRGDFTPPEWKEKYYNYGGTFEFRPIRGAKYWHQDQTGFVPGLLHHPIKPW